MVNASVVANARLQYHYTRLRFEASKLKIREILAVIYLNSMDVSQSSISSVTLISKPGISVLLECIRNSYAKKLTKCDLRLGSEGRTVEIDRLEWHLKSQANQKSFCKASAGKWVFGMFDRKKHVIRSYCASRKSVSNTFVPMIQKYSLPISNQEYYPMAGARIII